MTTSIISPETPQLKRCSKCGEVKPLDAFSRAKDSPDGLQYQCRLCNLDYRNAHKVERLAANREWVKNNRERNRENIRRGMAAYRERNREKIREQDRELKRKLRAENPEYIRQIRHNSRANRSMAEGKHTAAELLAVRAAQTDRKGRLICWRCGKPIKDTPHLDHWIPLHKGGSNDAGNLHYMHAKCNQTKSAKMPAEIGRLI